MDVHRERAHTRNNSLIVSISALCLSSRAPPATFFVRYSAHPAPLMRSVVRANGDLKLVVAAIDDAASKIRYRVADDVSQSR